MNKIYMTITDEQRIHLAAWKAERAHDPRFQALMAKAAAAHAALVKLASHFRADEE